MSEWDGDDYGLLPERKTGGWGAALLAGLVGVGAGAAVVVALGNVDFGSPQGFSENPPALTAVTQTTLWDADGLGELAGQELGWGGFGSDYASARMIYLPGTATDDLDAFVAAAEADGFDMGTVVVEPFDDTEQVLVSGTKTDGDIDLTLRISTFADGPSVYVYVDAYGGE